MIKQSLIIAAAAIFLAGCIATVKPVYHRTHQIYNHHEYDHGYGHVIKHKRMHKRHRGRRIK